MVDFLFRLLCSKYPRLMLSEFCSWIEILTTVPFMMVWFSGCAEQEHSLFRGCIMFDTSRVYLTKRVIEHMTTDNSRDILKIVNIILLIVFFPAAFCSYVENLDTYPEYVREDTTYFQMIYFIFISMTFIGYGSQVTSDYGKIFLTLFLLCCLVVLPAQAGKLMTLFAAKSPWARAKFEKVGKDVPHIVIMGQISPSNLKNFLDEFFHEDHEGSKKQCIVVQNCRPSNAILDCIAHPNYAQQVVYLEGDQRDRQTLIRADIFRADAVMILNDKMSFDASHADTEIIL